MSFSPLSSYRFEIISSFEKKEEFLVFLKTYALNLIEYKLSFYEQEGIDIKSREYKFYLKDLPPDPSYDLELPEELYEEQTIENDVEENPSLEDTLPQLDPFSSEILEIEIKLGDIISEFIKNLKFYTEIILNGEKHYFGIMPGVWFQNYPILLTTVLSTVDNGNLEYEPLHLFNFIIYTFSLNIDEIYQYFMSTDINIYKDTDTDAEDSDQIENVDNSYEYDSSYSSKSNSVEGETTDADNQEL